MGSNTPMTQGAFKGLPRQDFAPSQQPDFSGGKFNDKNPPMVRMRAIESMGRLPKPLPFTEAGALGYAGQSTAPPKPAPPSNKTNFATSFGLKFK